MKKNVEIIDRDVKTKGKSGKELKQYPTLKIGEKYKAEIIESIRNEELSVYYHGDTWHDLCRARLTSSSKIGKAFKLTKVSGAYWRGDSKMKCCKEFTELAGVQRRIRRLSSSLRRSRKRIIGN